MSVVARAKRALGFVVEPPRAVLDMVATPLTLPWLLRQRTDDGQPILVIQAMAPAIGTLEMRAVLKLLGHKVHSMGEFDTMRHTPDGVRKAVIRRVEELADHYGEPVTIAGWGYGGPFTRMAAHAVPDTVRQAITMGGLLEGMSYPKEYAWTGIEPLPVPTTVIYSRTDGYYSPDRICPPPAPRQECLGVPSSHNGMANHPVTLHVVADRLAQPKGSWRPYEPHKAEASPGGA